MIFNIGRGKPYKLPVLNASYPANVSVKYDSGSSTSATFKVVVDTVGYPESHSYQWYCDGSPISNATSSTYTRSGINSTGTCKIWCVVTNAAGTVKSREATLTSSQVFVKNWTGSSDMAFYYGDGSAQGATNVGVYNDLSTRYGQVLWFKMDAYGGKGFTFNWNPKAFNGYQKTVYCRISKTGKNSSGKWPGCTNGSGDLSYTVTSTGYQFSDSNFVFEPNETYYIYINRSWIGNTVAEGYGVHYYANGSTYGSSSITIR